jgi:hypothetical protein
MSPFSAETAGARTKTTRDMDREGWNIFIQDPASGLS